MTKCNFRWMHHKCVLNPGHTTRHNCACGARTYVREESPVVVNDSGSGEAMTRCNYRWTDHKCMLNPGHTTRHDCACGAKSYVGDESPVIVNDSGPVDMPLIATQMEKLADGEIESNPTLISVYVRSNGTTQLSFDLHKTETGVVTCNVRVRNPTVVSDGVKRLSTLNVDRSRTSGTDRIDLVRLSAKIAVALDEIIKDVFGGH